jgi:hypothetical protein
VEHRRLTPLMGVASIVLWVISRIVVAGDAPEDDATGADVAAYYDGALAELALGLILAGLATIALVWFLDGLRIHISRFSDQLGRLIFFFGFGAALFLLGTALPDAAGAFATDELGRELESGAAEALFTLGDGFFFGAQVLLVGFFLAASVAALRARAWPVWLGWISLALAILALIPPIGWAVVVLGLPLWILLVSALLFARSRSREPEAV